MTTAHGQGWAEKMFKDGLTHDFGTVPHGAQLYHRFTITNIYAVRMEVTGLVSGCGCVTATASKRVLEPRETAVVDVEMDARRFTGPKSVTIRVTVGPEYISTAELRVNANSRSDIVFNPGEVNLGTVQLGATPSATVDVEYAGKLDWQVSGTSTDKGAPLEATVHQLYRRPGQVGYQVKVTLKPDATPGPLKSVVYLKTNDPNALLVPIFVEGNVLSPLSVSPAFMSLGTVKPGEPLTRRVSVSGKKPFRVLGVEGAAEVTLGGEAAETAAAAQTVTLKIVPGQAGPFKYEVKIKTDLQEAPVIVTVEGTAGQ
jgi:hypothetical protein